MSWKGKGLSACNGCFQRRTCTRFVLKSLVRLSFPNQVLHLFPTLHASTPISSCLNPTSSLRILTWHLPAHSFSLQPLSSVNPLYLPSPPSSRRSHGRFRRSPSTRKKGATPLLVAFPTQQANVISSILQSFNRLHPSLCAPALFCRRRTNSLRSCWARPSSSSCTTARSQRPPVPSSAKFPAFFSTYPDHPEQKSTTNVCFTPPPLI